MNQFQSLSFFFYIRNKFPKALPLAHGRAAVSKQLSAPIHFYFILKCHRRVAPVPPPPFGKGGLKLLFSSNAKKETPELSGVS